MKTIHYISDTHWDHWIDANLPLYAQEKKFLGALPQDIKEFVSDILIVAGDLGHSNDQNVLFFEILKRYFKNIVFVTGNHDLYLIKKYGDFRFSEDRLKDLINKTSKIENVHHLDGTVVNIDGVRFGGGSIWHDDYYARKYSNLNDFQIDWIWENRISDSVLIKSRYEFDFRFHFQKEWNKFKNIIDDSDILVSHYPPMTRENVQPQWKDDPLTYLFLFNPELLDGFDISGKTWIYGHQHTQTVWQDRGCTFVSNPLGYPGENLEFLNQIKIGKFEI